MKNIACAFLISFISILFLVTFGICGESNSDNIEIDGILTPKGPLNGKPGPYSYKLVVETTPYDKYEGEKKKAQELIGWDVGPQIVMIKYVNFTFAEYSIEFPKRSIDDLCRVDIRPEQYLPVAINGEHIIITMSGGDASSYYQVRFILKLGKKSLRLIKREVSLYPPWDFKDPDDVKTFE